MKRTQAIVLTAAALVLGGCAATPPAPAGPPPQVTATHQRRLADGRLWVAATLSAPAAVSGTVMCQFLDRAGQPIGAPATQTITLAPAEPGTVQFAAADGAAADAKISFRP